MSTKDPLNFGETPKRNPKFKAPAELPKDRPALLALVAKRGGFPPRAARWLAPRELRALLTGDFPFESSAIYAVREPRQIASEDELLNLCAERRVAYYAEQRAKKADAKADTQKADTRTADAKGAPEAQPANSK
jgi:hypothetical protein